MSDAALVASLVESFSWHTRVLSNTHTWGVLEPEIVRLEQVEVAVRPRQSACVGIQGGSQGPKVLPLNDGRKAGSELRLRWGIGWHCDSRRAPMSAAFAVYGVRHLPLYGIVW